jgi:four helix bundle protein
MSLLLSFRRSSTSIPFNIAEGWAGPTRVYLNHLGIALGSEAELKTQLKVGLAKKYATQDEIARLLATASEIGRMLNGLIKSLRRRVARRRRP